MSSTNNLWNFLEIFRQNDKSTNGSNNLVFPYFDNTCLAVTTKGFELGEGQVVSSNLFDSGPFIKEVVDYVYNELLKLPDELVNKDHVCVNLISKLIDDYSNRDDEQFSYEFPDNPWIPDGKSNTISLSKRELIIEEVMERLRSVKLLYKQYKMYSQHRITEQEHTQNRQYYLCGLVVNYHNSVVYIWKTWEREDKCFPTEDLAIDLSGKRNLRLYTRGFQLTEDLINFFGQFDFTIINVSGIEDIGSITLPETIKAVNFIDFNKTHIDYLRKYKGKLDKVTIPLKGIDRDPELLEYIRDVLNENLVQETTLFAGKISISINYSCDVSVKIESVSSSLLYGLKLSSIDKFVLDYLEVIDSKLTNFDRELVIQQKPGEYLNVKFDESLRNNFRKSPYYQYIRDVSSGNSSFKRLTFVSPVGEEITFEAKQTSLSVKSARSVN